MKNLLIRESLHLGKKSSVFRGTREGQSVIIKVLEAENPSPKEIAKIKKEFDIAANLDFSGIVKPLSIEIEDDKYALVLEDIGGVSLNQLIREANDKKEIRLDLSRRLSIAIKISEALEHIHSKEIIHLDIKPHNVIVNMDSNRVQVTDFGISTRLTRENPTINSPENMEGTLAYISPEQTGRMNRSIDYRTDFYSLGVTFYELFTGRLPFVTKDPMELIHSHIAVKPELPHQVVNNFPPILSEIILRLMAKNAEDRYLSAYGIKRDLEKCLELYEKGILENTSFGLGEYDKSDKFQIPQKLYGREKEIQILLDSFDRTSLGKREVIIVNGYSGIGKSVLVNEVHKPIVNKRGYFISGKYDQFKRDIPYSAVIQSFQELIRQILTESEESIQTWKNDFLKALSPNAQVIVNVIPELEIILGKQLPVQDLSPSESQNRFNQTFKEFLKVLSTKEHPIVLFLDDMQWADSDSLKLIQNIMSDSEISYLLFICSYRSNEVDSTHQLIHTLDQIEKSDCKIETLSLKVLQEEDIQKILSETFASNQGNVIELAKIIISKTDGNPFFVNEFLKSLYNESLIFFNRDSSKWEWDISKIENAGITDNVIELMTSKILKLSLGSQKIIQIASCIGNIFNLSMLSLIYEKKSIETFSELSELMLEGYILPIGEEHKYLDEFSDPNKIHFKFLHDRVQQAAYSCLSEQQAKKIHLQIGQYLLKNLSSIELEDKLFDLVNHWNLSSTLLTKVIDKQTLAEINFKAGIKARKSIAYEVSNIFLSNSIQDLSMIDEDKSSSYLFEYANSCYYITKFDEAEAAYDRLLLQNITKLHKIEILKWKCLIYLSRGDVEKTIDQGLNALDLLGIKITKKPNELSSIKDILYCRYLFFRKNANEIIEMKEANDPVAILALDLLEKILPAAFISSPFLVPHLVTKMVILSLKNGNSINSSVGYVLLGYIFIIGLKDFKLGHELGLISLKLADKYNSSAIKGRTYYCFACLVAHFNSSFDSSIQYFFEGTKSSLEASDIQFIAYNSNHYSIQSFLNSDKLDKVQNNFESYRKVLLATSQLDAINYNKIWNELVNILADVNISIGKKIITSVDKEKLEETKSLLVLFNLYFLNGFIYFLSGNYEAALIFFLKTEQFEQTTLGMPYSTLNTFLFALTISKLKNPTLLKKFRKKLSEISKRAEYSPENFLSMKLILDAQESIMSNNILKATKIYHDAIKIARDNNNYYLQAIAFESLSDIYLSIGNTSEHSFYLLQSRSVYVKWGALAKVKQIDEKYPNLVKSFMQLVGTINQVESDENGAVSVTISSDPSKTRVSTTKRLDVGSIFKASQTLSGEIQLEKLLSKMMKFVLENAGAEKGCLILANEKGELFVEASGSVSSKEVKVLESIPLKNYTSASTSVIQFVSRTKSNIVLSDAHLEGNFVNDSYVKTNQVYSLLCAPILNQGKLVGIIYLENNLTTGAFTRDRIEVLQILASQAAISIDNAKLYTNLEHRVRERTKEIGDILSNVEQGILTLNRDFSINPDYSRKVLDIFEVKELLVKDFRELVSEDKQTKVHNFIELLFDNPFMSAKMFEKSNPLKEYTYLYPQEGGIVKQLSFSFSRIFKLDNEGNKTDEIEKIMVVIDDRTAEYELQKRLEEKTKEQASKVEKMYQILGMDAKIFSGFIKEANETIDLVKPKLQSLLNEKESSIEKAKSIESNRKIIEETFRAVHSLKGNARALNLESIGERAHKLEDELDKLRSNVSEIQKEFIERTL
ncbi:MAG: AAA family ATPase, partial [Leptospiraceae bacterium]|nr:AAA family ATPase [Leptospiraceae bacterium]